MSKILEKVLEHQIKVHLNNFNIIPEEQSGFRRGHSCATSLLKVTDDILTATDRGHITTLILLDYSKAFDTLVHEILYAIMHFAGFSSSAVAFIRSYLNLRTQQVRCGEVISDPLPVLVGVPQGSILGPLLFILYTHYIRTFLKYCLVHFYADDTQMYLSFPADQVEQGIARLNEDLQMMNRVAGAHQLILNPAKSQAIFFGNAAVCSDLSQSTQFKIGDEVIPIVSSVKNLGLFMDNTFRFRTHIASCVQKSITSLRLLYPHRRSLSGKIKTMLCNSLVLSNFTYCSPVFSACLDQETVRKVQKIQNSCLRFIYGIRKFDRISHKLPEAGWLNMVNRFKLSALVLYHRIVTTATPSYLHRKIRYRSDIHNLNIRTRGLISAPPHRLALFERSFTFCVYKLYNQFIHLKSLSVNSFRKRVWDILFSEQCAPVR